MIIALRWFLPETCINGKTFSGKELGSSKLVELIAREIIFQEAVDECRGKVQIAQEKRIRIDSINM